MNKGFFFLIQKCTVLNVHRYRIIERLKYPKLKHRLPRSVCTFLLLLVPENWIFIQIFSMTVSLSKH